MAKKTIQPNTMSDIELAKFVAEKQEALRVFRFGISGSKIKNVKEGAKLKIDIARALTELSLRKLATRAK